MGLEQHVDGIRNILIGDGVPTVANQDIDPDKLVTIHQRGMHSKQDGGLHEGFEVTGWPTMTVSSGEIIVENGKVNAEPGCGKLVKRRTCMS